MRPEEVAHLAQTKRQWTITFAVIAAVFLWSGVSTGFNPVDVIIGIPDMLHLLRRMYPPRWDYLPTIVAPLLQTFQIALLGTIAGAVLAVPMMFVTARNTAGHPLVYRSAKFVLTLIRTVPDMLLASIFSAAVGIGPFAGVLALGVFSFGIITKLSCETIETIDPGPTEALRATGAQPLNIIQYAIVPQILPNFISYCLYMFEINVRAATIVGLVGAGGIGMFLLRDMDWMAYRSAAMIVLVIFTCVGLLDLLSSWLRGRLV